ncbi:MAG: hypothetical protein PF501_17645, partial [Salinisphaera sp.]|nr:hypothetical protein [Salinisphaera sp.]
MVRSRDADEIDRFGFAISTRQVDLRLTRSGDVDMCRFVICCVDDEPETVGAVNDNHPESISQQLGYSSGQRSEALVRALTIGIGHHRNHRLCNTHWLSRTLSGKRCIHPLLDSSRPFCDQTKELIQDLPALRPTLLQKPLVACRSIKAKRL